ncbi:hypothetical protein CANARDRAFT_29018 [[Candida] arabinofermentans NRRL YB-2248]|uniref:Major facilitator superfamily (MFS) profile domain-containing protein n=1 Tax=[Candida] arabinofermentans NRRL YB-2248 TaxID=983967 RepID=A0A1E4SYA6_9ASCO|nr:hypothetical protein CANARDRAFT_29018 [[Candida] arabinofermentans NRRL YB-2248]
MPADIESINSVDGYNAENASVQSETENHLQATHSRVSGLVHSITNHHAEEEEDQAKLKQMISNRSEAVSKVVSNMEEGYGALGPLEDPIDAERTASQFHQDPSTDYHELDEWKYPIDLDTQMRLVVFVDGDKGNPNNWSFGYRWFLTILLGIVCFDVALASAIVTGDTAGPMETFNVSEEVIILTVTLFVLGFAFGPLLFAPLSEELGRRVIYVTTLAFGVIFIIPCADAKNIGTLLVCRLIDGLAFSAPMCLIGGSLADLFTANERGMAMSVFSAAPFLGPVVGPLVGGYIGDNVGWRWIYWVLLIFSGVVYAFMVVFMPETSHSHLLKLRAKKLRKLTGDDSYRSLSELRIRSTKEIVHQTILRPFTLLSELIVFLITLYMSIVYGLLYMFFFAFPVVYMEGKGWSASKTGLMFIPVAVGVALAGMFAPYINRDYLRRVEAYKQRGELPPAELRLIPMMVGCWFVPVGLFSFAWSSYPSISWAGPCFSGLACGFGFNMLYNPANNYIVDSYQHYAASALAAKTFVRSIWGASVPLFTIQMYHRLGYEWASSLMAFIALACCAIPFGFFFYGARIRQKSKYAYSPEMDKEEDVSSIIKPEH